MQIPTELLPVVQITLPLLAGMFLAGWMQNRRLDEISKRLDDIIRRIEAIEARLVSIEGVLRGQGERITRLEERSRPPVFGR